MVQKLSLTSEGSKFLSFWYCNYYCVIRLKCSMHFTAVGSGLCCQWNKERRLWNDQTGKVLRLCYWTNGGDRCSVEKVHMEKEARWLIIQCSIRLTCCSTEQVKTKVIGLHLYLRDSWISWIKYSGEQKFFFQCSYNQLRKEYVIR